MIQESRKLKKKQREGEKMLSWLSSLFGKKKQRLTEEQKKNIVTDCMINKMKQKDVAVKYNISAGYVSRLVRQARDSHRI